MQKNRENVWGFRAKKSHQILPVAPTCPILVPKLREFLKSPEALAIQAQELQVFENGNGEISYYYNGMSNQEFSEKSESVVEIAGKKIHSDASVFFQSNLGLLPILVKRVLEEAGEPVAGLVFVVGAADRVAGYEFCQVLINSFFAVLHACYFLLRKQVFK